jgi:peptidoglycan/xylan/chitin deacetylase (PgdA/CDA1 family)
MQNWIRRAFSYALLLWVVGAAFCAQAASAPIMKIAMIKADDVRGPTQKWKRFIEISRERNVKVSCGVICDSLVNAKKEYADWLIVEEQSEFVEFWNHGWDHKKWETNGVSISEFGGSGYAHQKEHFVEAQEIMQSVLGRPTRAFGTPYNSFDNDTARVLKEAPSVKLLFCYKDPKVDGIIAAKMALRGEPDGTGKPNAAKFAEQYNKVKDTIPFAAIQFHPNSFPDDSFFDEYAKTLDILQKDGWIFMLPREYLAWRDKQKK